jgi:hypothetical protein
VEVEVEVGVEGVEGDAYGHIVSVEPQEEEQEQESESVGVEVQEKGMELRAYDI